VLANVLDPLYQIMGSILAAIYSVVPNYIIAIIGLTVLVLAALTPLTLKGMRSQITMQKLAPEVKRLQAEYKDDRMAMNEAVMALYKEHGANPISGCLPFIVQSPFFFALFGVLRGISRVEYRVGQAGTNFAAWPLVKDKAHQADQGVVRIGVPKHIPKGSKLYDSLFGTKNPLEGSGLPKLSHNAGEVKAWGFDLAKSASEAVKQGFGTFLPYFALIVAMVLLQIFAQQQITKRNPQAAAANPQMQMINKVFPFLFGIWGWAFQAGLTLYWAVSAALRIVQQTALYRFDPKLAESVRERKAEFERDVRTAVEKKGNGKDKAQPAKGQTRPAAAKAKVGPKEKVQPQDRVLKPAPQAAGGNAKPNPGRQQPKKRRKGR
jgi:YidC/Oxa1 family membrane protein insertase